MADCFGIEGYNVNTPNELMKTLNKVTTTSILPVIINIVIDPASGRKPQVSMHAMV